MELEPGRPSGRFRASGSFGPFWFDPTTPQSCSVSLNLGGVRAQVLLGRSKETSLKWPQLPKLQPLPPRGLLDQNYARLEELRSREREASIPAPCREVFFGFFGGAFGGLGGLGGLGLGGFGAWLDWDWG